jgi:hypothetical protein
VIGPTRARAAFVLSLALAASVIVGTAGPAAAARTATASPDLTGPPPAAWRPVSQSAESGGIAMAPGTNGRLFVAIQRATSTVVAGFDSNGRLLAGWPRTFSGWTDCWIGAALTDGSVRLLSGRGACVAALLSGRRQRGRRGPALGCPGLEARLWLRQPPT